MLPDVVDEAAANVSNVRREELFYAFFVFGNKLATGVTLGISTGIYKYVELAHNIVKPSLVPSPPPQLLLYTRPHKNGWLE